MMYDELIGDLRYCDKGDCTGCRRYTNDTRFCNTLLREAADAIEELSNKGIPTGRWEELEITDDKCIDEWQSARCSVCGKYLTTPYLYYFGNYNYCPNCGSRMEVVE